MTHYGDMANAVYGAEKRLEEDKRTRHDNAQPLIRVKPYHDGLCWIGRISDPITGEDIWIPLPFTTLADWQTVKEGMRELGYQPILDQ